MQILKSSQLYLININGQGTFGLIWPSVTQMLWNNGDINFDKCQKIKSFLILFIYSLNFNAMFEKF